MQTKITEEDLEGLEKVLEEQGAATAEPVATLTHPHS
jgi:hypothetical protein